MTIFTYVKIGIPFNVLLFLHMSQAKEFRTLQFAEFVSICIKIQSCTLTPGRYECLHDSTLQTLKTVSE